MTSLRTKNTEICRAKLVDFNLGRGRLEQEKNAGILVGRSHRFDARIGMNYAYAWNLGFSEVSSERKACDRNGLVSSNLTPGACTIRRTNRSKTLHRWGQVCAPKELLRREYGESYNPDWLIRYLEMKYLYEESRD